MGFGLLYAFTPLDEVMVVLAVTRPDISGPMINDTINTLITKGDTYFDMIDQSDTLELKLYYYANYIGAIYGEYGIPIAMGSAKGKFKGMSKGELLERMPSAEAQMLELQIKTSLNKVGEFVTFGKGSNRGIEIEFRNSVKMWERHEAISKGRTFRNGLPKKLKKAGNVGYAKIDIKGVDIKERYAHSKVDYITDKGYIENMIQNLKS